MIYYVGPQKHKTTNHKTQQHKRHYYVPIKVGTLLIFFKK